MDVLDRVILTNQEDWRKDFWCKPVHFREFVTSKEQLNLTPLSSKQYEAIFKLIGEDPLMVFSMKRIKHVGVFLWGKGCISGSTILKDEKTGNTFTIKELYIDSKSIYLKSFDEELKEDVIIKSGIPFIKGEDEMFEVSLSNGNKIQVTKEHIFLTPSGWKTLSELTESDEIWCENV